MNMEKENVIDSDQFFVGKWMVVNIFEKTAAGWEVLKEYRDESLILDFTGNIMVTEQAGDEELVSEYTWHPERKELFIDRQDVDERSVFSLPDNRNRMEQLSETECFAFGLDGVVKEPDDYRLKMLLKRIE
jgi:hypothetical protein